MPANPIQAFSVLLTLMLLPAFLMLGFGLRFWYQGRQQQSEDRLRLGRMLFLFGIILLITVAIVSFFLTGKMPGV